MLAWLSLAMLTGVLADDGFVPLAPIGLEDEPWGQMIPLPGPPRNGEPTEALRWYAAKATAPNSPALLRDFSGVEAIRFWLHVEQPLPFKLNLVMTGRTNGYFNAAVPLDFAGWRQITLPLSEFAKVREADWTTTTALGFRSQGYGQPPLTPELVIWVDQLEARPRPGASLTPGSSLEDNRRAWTELAARGNPLLLLNAERYATTAAPFAPPTNLTSAWTYRTVAEELLALAYAAAAPESPHRGRADLLDRAVAATDWLVRECREGGWWWMGGPTAGDVNVNRFTLGPLLDAVLYLRQLPAGEAAWPRWRERLERAIDLQRRAYRGEVKEDWGGLAGGEYANQDAYYILIMALSARLCDRPADQALAEEMVRKVALNLLPDGGIHYIGVDNESPIYHSLNLIIIGRYATLTGDRAAQDLLRGTAAYWPMTMGAEGYPESWSDVWWKQNWGMPWREGMVVAAGATGDARNQFLLWRVLERSGPSEAGMATIYAAPYWSGTAPGEPPPDRFLVRDRNIRGVHGRDGNWYYGLTQGRGLRNTFVGGLITSPKAVNPLQAAFRGAQIDVLQDARPNGLLLSQIDDNTALTVGPTAAALGARYRLQPRLINGVPTPVTPDTPWQVTQAWRAAGDGLIGLVVCEAVAKAPGTAVVARLALGPRAPEIDGDAGACGPLRFRFYQRFGTLSVQPVPHYTTPLERAWPGVELRAPIPGAEAGERFSYLVWLGPETATAPAAVRALPGDAGWVATWPDGRWAAVAFNPGETACEVKLPEGGRAFAGEDGAVVSAPAGTVMVAPHSALLAEG